MRQKTVQNGFFIALLALTTLAFLWLIWDFLLPVFWAAVLATLFFPLQQRFTERLNGRASLAAVFSLLTILFIVILPLFLVGWALAQESIELYERIAAGEVDLQAPVQFIERTLPLVAGYLESVGVELDRVREGLSNAAVTSSQFLASQALTVGQNALRFSVLLFLMLYILFFFLRDGERMVGTLIWVLPLGDKRERQLFSKFAEVSRATIKGTLVVGIVQGGLGGLLFWILGLPAPVFWGVVMAVLSFLPAVGAALVWGPAALVLLVTGEIAKGLILIVAGTLVVSLVDNILRPILVGRETRMPDFLVLLSTLGGLAVFGISGIVIGPIIAAFFLAVWAMFAREYAEDNTEAVKEAMAPDAPSTASPPAPSEQPTEERVG